MSFDEEYIDPHGECAAEIHRLQSENTRLREVLGEIVDPFGNGNAYDVSPHKIARARSLLQKYGRE